MNRPLSQFAMLGLVSFAALAGTGTTATTPALPLIGQSDLHYVGAFKLPGGTFGTSSFAYGGTAMAYNPAKKSLFLVGHDQQQQAAEISIPALVNSSSVSALNQATVLQPFADPLEGRTNQIATDIYGVKVGGLLVDGDKLYGTSFIYYDASGSQSLTHWVRSTTLSQASVQGPYALTSYGGGYTSGYLARIPQAWQTLLGGPVLNGQCCIPIMSRTSYGPGAFALDVTKIAQAVTPSMLLFYPQSHPLAIWDQTSTLFNGSTHIAGVVFPDGSGSVLWFGRQGLGTYCYGYGTTIQPVPPPDAGGTGYCYDPTSDSKGNHAYPYRYYVWAYKATDLAAVKAGTKQSWEIRPDATWTLSLPITTWIEQLQGVTYDPSAQRIYVSQAFGDGDRPLIHAFDLDLAAVPSMPSPLNVRIIK